MNLRAEPYKLEAKTRYYYYVVYMFESNTRGAG